MTSVIRKTKDLEMYLEKRIEILS